MDSALSGNAKNLAGLGCGGKTAIVKENTAHFQKEGGGRTKGQLVERSHKRENEVNERGGARQENITNRTDKGAGRWAKSCLRTCQVASKKTLNKVPRMPFIKTKRGGGQRECGGVLFTETGARQKKPTE